MNTVYVSTYEELVDAFKDREAKNIILTESIDFQTESEIWEMFRNLPHGTNITSRGKGKKVKDWDNRGR